MSSVKYAVTEGTDIIKCDSNGTITVLATGTAEISVTLGENTVTVSVIVH